MDALWTLFMVAYDFNVDLFHTIPACVVAFYDTFLI